MPSLKAPGFIKFAADGTFADVSAAASGSLVLRVRSSTPEYTGFRVSFAAGTIAPRWRCGLVELNTAPAHCCPAFLEYRTTVS